MVLASVMVFGQYGTVLFVATPFVMGAAAAYIFNCEVPRPVGVTLIVAALAVFAAGSAMLLFALEGMLCLAMAAPPAIVMALMGAALGRAIALRPRASRPGWRRSSCPCRCWRGSSRRGRRRSPSEVLTTVEIAAPPRSCGVTW